MPSSPARPPPALAELAGTLLDLAIVALLLGTAVARWAPPQDLPWTPLRLEAPLGLFTVQKFEVAAQDPARCRALLSAAQISFSEDRDRSRGDCPTANIVRLQGGTVRLSPAAPAMTCGEALAYAFWVRHDVQPAARAELGATIIRIDHYGTFACRNVYGRAQAPRSEHAFANAIDVAGFHTTGGQGATVARDFRDEGPKGRFLRDVRRGACRWFRAVLSPDYNAAHRDHLHLDRGRYRACR